MPHKHKIVLKKLEVHIFVSPEESLEKVGIN